MMNFSGNCCDENKLVKFIGERFPREIFSCLIKFLSLHNTQMENAICYFSLRRETCQYHDNGTVFTAASACLSYEDLDHIVFVCCEGCNNPDSLHRSLEKRIHKISLFIGSAEASALIHKTHCTLIIPRSNLKVS